MTTIKLLLASLMLAAFSACTTSSSLTPAESPAGSTKPKAHAPESQGIKADNTMR